MGQDIRQALRLLTRAPGFCAVAILTLALGIGSATSVFTVVYTVLLRPLPYPAPERLLQVWERQADGFHAMPSDPNFEDLHERNRSFRAFAQYAPRQRPVTVGDETVRATTSRVSAEFFDVLRVHPSMGRAFLPGELHVGAAPVAVVSDQFWRRHFAGHSELAGATIRVGQKLHTIAGVMPPGFDFPFGSDVWVPREQSDKRSGRTGRNSRAVARLGPDVTLAQARTDLSVIAKHLKRQYGDDTRMLDVDLVPLQEEMVASVRPALLIQLVAAGFLLLVACANVLSLLAARAAARGRELAVRAALGAGRWRLVRQSVVESGMLSMAGCALGVLAAVWSLALIQAIAPAHLPRISELAIGWPVVGFAVAAAIAISLLLGLVVAWRAAARQLHLSLHESRGTIGDHAPHRLRHALVVVQVAVTLVLLVGAGLLTRSVVRLLDRSPGFRMSDVALLHLYQPPLDTSLLDDLASAKSVRVQQLDRIVGRMARLPGVLDTGLVNAFPLTGAGSFGTFVVADGLSEGRTEEDFMRLAKDPSRSGTAHYRVASEGYFRAMGIPLIRGRLFDERDRIETRHVAVISETLARTQWPDRDPIGRRIQFGNMDGDPRLLTVVGIVGDVRDEGLDAAPDPILYTCYRQRPQTGFSVVMHTAGAPADLGSAVRAAAREVAAEIPTRFASIDEVVGTWLGWRRTALVLLGVFAVTALLLAVAGLYGAMAYAVAQRTQEMGIRAALGADRGALLRLVLVRGLVIVVVGVAIGIVSALALTGFLQSLLYGITSSDPLTLVTAAILLTIVAMAACYVPARRAARVDAVIALRAE